MAAVPLASLSHRGLLASQLTPPTWGCPNLIVDVLPRGRAACAEDVVVVAVIDDQQAPRPHHACDVLQRQPVLTLVTCMCQAGPQTPSAWASSITLPPISRPSASIKEERQKASQPRQGNQSAIVRSGGLKTKATQGHRLTFAVWQVSKTVPEADDSIEAISCWHIFVQSQPVGFFNDWRPGEEYRVSGFTM